MRDYTSIEYFLNQMKENKIRYSDGQLFRGDKLIKGSVWGKGRYLGIHSRSKGIKMRSLIHRLVFAYFHGLEELQKYETIDHINGDKYDNRIENLQGMSSRENSKKSNPNMLSIEAVIEIKERLANGETTVKLGKEFGVSNVTISKIKRGLRYRTI